MSNFLTHSKFFSQQEADNFIILLEESNIDFEIEYEKNVLDKVYIGETLDPLIAVKDPEFRFDEVNKLLLKHAETQLADIDPNYYLYNFTNDELFDVLNNREEWNFFDQALAAKILSDRKIEMPSKIDKINVKDGYSPTTLDNLAILVEYIFSILVAYVGIIIGLATVFAFRTLNKCTTNRPELMGKL